MPTLTIADLHNVSAIKVDGCPYANAAVVDSAGSGHDSNVFSLPRIKASTIKDVTAIDTIEDEAKTAFSTLGKHETSLELTFMQLDTATKDLMVSTLRDKYVTLVKADNNTAIDGKYTVTIIPYAYANPSFEHTAGNAEIKATFTGTPSKALMTLDLREYDTNFPTTLTCTLLTIPANTTLVNYSQAA